MLYHEEYGWYAVFDGYMEIMLLCICLVSCGVLGGLLIVVIIVQEYKRLTAIIKCGLLLVSLVMSDRYIAAPKWLKRTLLITDLWL